MSPKYLVDAMLCDTLVSSSFRMRLLTFARRLLVPNDRIKSTIVLLKGTLYCRYIFVCKEDCSVVSVQNDFTMFYAV